MYQTEQPTVHPTTLEYGIPHLGDPSYRRDVLTILLYLVIGVRWKTAARCLFVHTRPEVHYDNLLVILNYNHSTSHEGEFFSCYTAS